MPLRAAILAPSALTLVLILAHVPSARFEAPHAGAFSNIVAFALENGLVTS